MGDWMKSPNSQPITVFIVDDHPLFRDGLKRALEFEDDIVVIGYSETGEEAIIITRELQPDIILLDINLPGMNGLQVARQIKAERAHTAIIILTAHHDTEQVLHVMRAGASAYCSKDVSADNLIAILRDVAGGYYIIEDKRMTEREVKSWINAHIEALAGPYIADGDEHFIPLSPREMQILQFVTQGMSNKQIATRLDISQQTVKNHMTAILKKLNVEDRTQAAVMAIRRGWVRVYNSEGDAD